MTGEWLLLLLAVLLVGANALFVFAEFSLVTVNRPDVAKAAEGGDAKAVSLQKALRQLSTQLSGAQLGITVTSLTVGYLAQPSLAALLRGPLGLVGVPEAAVAGVSITVALIVATGTQMVFGELVPKNWAIAEPMRVGRAVAGLQRGFSTATKPLLTLLNGSANWVVRLLGIEPREELASGRSAQELSLLATRSADQGVLSGGLAARVGQTVDLAELTAADAMTPRIRVWFIDQTDSVADVLTKSAGTGNARFPVVGESHDDITGVVHFKHALAVPPEERDDKTVAEIARPLPDVPDSMPLISVLAQVRSGVQMAAVIDEFGGTAGIITLEDLVEEIVGEIEDEQDRGNVRHRFLETGAMELSGMLRPDELEEIAGLGLPEPENSESLGGLVTERLERFAQVGDEIVLDARDHGNRDEEGISPEVSVTLTVARMDGRRVDRVRLAIIRDHDDGAAGQPEPDNASGGDARA